MYNNYSELKALLELLWGNSGDYDDAFRLWSQGFVFSESEPSALSQRCGGPCGVLAPTQAYLLKTLLAESSIATFADLTAEKCKALLVTALCQILTKCRSNKNTYYVITLKDLSKSTGCSTSVASEEEPVISLDDELDPTTFHNLLVIIEMNDIEHVKQFYVDTFDILESR